VATDTGEIGGRYTSLLGEQVGVAWYVVWDKLLAGSSEHYCMDTDYNIFKTMRRPKGCLGWQTVPLCDDAKCLWAVYESPNLVYKRQIKDVNL